MIGDPGALIGEFAESAQDLYSTAIGVEHEVQRAPHQPHSLPPGKAAVYVFSLSDSFGKGSPAGSHRVLKVGKTGPNSNARFQSQHYNLGSSGSNLAKSLLSHRILWPYLGLNELSETNVAEWIESNTDRDHFYLDVKTGDECLSDLERYLRARLGPVFEGG